MLCFCCCCNQGYCPFGILAHKFHAVTAASAWESANDHKAWAVEVCRLSSAFCSMIAAKGPFGVFAHLCYAVCCRVCMQHVQYRCSSADIFELSGIQPPTHNCSYVTQTCFPLLHLCVASRMTYYDKPLSYPEVAHISRCWSAAWLLFISVVHCCICMSSCSRKQPLLTALPRVNTLAYRNNILRSSTRKRGYASLQRTMPRA